MDGLSPSVQPLPFPFQPGAPPGAPGTSNQNNACSNLFMSDVHVGELMTIAPQDPIMATGL